MYLQYLPVAKLAAQVVAGLGVSKIVNDIIVNNVTVVTTMQKVTVKAGGFVLGSMLWEQSANHIERAANEVVEKLQNHKAEADETKS